MIKGFCNIIVRPGIKPRDDVLFTPLGSKKNKTGHFRIRKPADVSANLRAVHFRHHPVKDG